jgi:signal transduction histidine kinase
MAFHDSPSYLADCVAAFLASGARIDAVAVVIATSEHHAEFEVALPRWGIDTTADYVRLDAVATLERLRDDGALDPARFRSLLPQLEDAGGEGRPIYVYGEMVALLWQRGDVAGALALEDLWNELAVTHEFAVLCGYPATVEGTPDLEAFRRLCDAHTLVLPSEGFASREDVTRRFDTLSTLQEQALARAAEREARRRQHQQLEQALDRAKAAEEARRDFTAMVVHDVRNPAVVVSGVLDLLREREGQLDPGQVRELLATADRNVTRIHRLLDDILLLARVESGEFRYDLAPVDLSALVLEIVADLERESGRRIETAVPAKLPPVLADEGRQVQILSNLLSNATKFSPASSIVSISVEERGSHLAVEVRDEGVGVEASDLPRLFQPFARLAPRSGAGVKGTGLGLFITKILIEGQGGTIDVVSAPDVGTTFTYTVPTADRT